MLIAGALVTTQLGAQTVNNPEFAVASVRANKSGDQTAQSNFPLGPGSVYVPNGGHFSATNYPLATYIYFAYKIMGNQEQALRAQLPEWVTTEHFDIEARTDGNPVLDTALDTKDQMRLMMRSLLADRFKLVMHAETRQVPVFGLVLAKPGKTGPWLQAHPDDSSCSTGPAPPANQLAGQFPALCGGLLPMPPAHGSAVKFGARNVTMQFIANQLTALGQLDRPVFDQTGLRGSFDFALEFTPESNGNLPPAADLGAVPQAPAFMDALQEQIGLKLLSQKGPSDALVLDHVERPSAN